MGDRPIFPICQDEDAVWDWLSCFQNKYLSHSRCILYTTKSTSDLTGGKAKRQLDVFVTRRGIETSVNHKWKDVCVIGELKRSKWPFKLARYMRDAFCCSDHPPLYPRLSPARHNHRVMGV